MDNLFREGFCAVGFTHVGDDDLAAERGRRYGVRKSGRMC